MTENKKKDVFNIKYETTLQQLVHTFPEVVTILDDLSPDKSFTKKDFMGNMSTIEEFANDKEFETDDLIKHLRKELAEKYSYPANGK